MTDHIDDDDTAHAARRSPEPDAHGQAAMLLVESLLHALVARSVLSIEEAVVIVEVAADTRAEIAHDLGDADATLDTSIRLLESIGTSLAREASRR